MKLNTFSYLIAAIGLLIFMLSLSLPVHKIIAMLMVSISMIIPGVVTFFNNQKTPQSFFLMVHFILGIVLAFLPFMIQFTDLKILTITCLITSNLIFIGLLFLKYQPPQTPN